MSDAELRLNEGVEAFDLKSSAELGKRAGNPDRVDRADDGVASFDELAEGATVHADLLPSFFGAEALPRIVAAAVAGRIARRPRN